MTNSSSPSEKFHNKYRIPSARAGWWDYAAAGAYFITICTADRAHLFGAVRAGQMMLSPLGDIVREEWERSFTLRRELHCDVYVIMPNHIHGIVRIVKTDGDGVETHGGDGVETHGGDGVETHGGDGVETHGRASLHGVAYRASRSISSFVAGFKSATTKRINEQRHTPGAAVWQTRFHDHIIRNAGEYQRIATYIINNPVKWTQDGFFEPSS